jgi:hypothetical protein
MNPTENSFAPSHGESGGGTAIPIEAHMPALFEAGVASQLTKLYWRASSLVFQLKNLTLWAQVISRLEEKLDDD